jgi:hypothetical protein
MAQESMPSSVPWQTFQLNVLCITAVRLLPPSALAALSTSFNLIFRVVPGPASFIAAQIWPSTQRFGEATLLEGTRGRSDSMLNHCTLLASVIGRFDEDSSPQADLQAWAYCLHYLAPLASGLGIPSVCLTGLAGMSLDIPDALPVPESLADYHPHVLSSIQRNEPITLGALLEDAFQELHSLELRGCDISPSHLAPLLSTAPVKDLQLTWGTQLGTSPEESLPALLNLLSNGSIEHLEVVDSLWGERLQLLEQHLSSHLASERPVTDQDMLLTRILGPPPSSNQVHSLTHLQLHNCGPLQSLVPLLRLMPSLTHLEVSHRADLDVGVLQEPLERLLPGMPRLRTLLLPDSSYDGLFPPALLMAGSLRHVEVRRTDLHQKWGVQNVSSCCSLWRFFKVSYRCAWDISHATVQVLFFCGVMHAADGLLSVQGRLLSHTMVARCKATHPAGAKRYNPAVYESEGRPGVQAGAQLVSFHHSTLLPGVLL